MIIINKMVKNNYGEIVTPIAVNGDSVVCIDLSGETINRKVEDFSDESELINSVEQKKNFIVPIQLPPEDMLFTENEVKESEDNDFIEETKDSAVISNKKILTFNLIAKVNDNGN